jgi:hypothetical protein
MNKRGMLLCKYYFQTTKKRVIPKLSHFYMKLYINPISAEFLLVLRHSSY